MNICIVVVESVHTLLMSDFISMLVKNTMYSIIRGDYDVFVASWGDDLEGDLVPHVCRVDLGTLHV